MSKIKENAYEAALNTSMKIVDNRTIEFTDAAILWPDFEGRITKYHTKEGAQRSFNLVISDDILAALRELEARSGSKFNIRETPVDTEGNDPRVIHYINVKVSYRRNDGTPVANPPRITVLSEYNGKKSRCNIDETTAKTIDHMDIKGIDFRVNLFIRPVDPTKCTMYLKTAWITQEPDIEFGGKYDEYLDEPAGPEMDLPVEENVF